MKVSGFTFIRNAVRFDYPIVEAITSILPVCDEMIVAVGNSDDETLALIEAINSPKIKIIHTVWDDNLRVGGKVLALETNKALAAVSKDSDWCFYIQGDEVVHEKYLSTILEAMQKYKNDEKVEGILFQYKHFYGSYRYIGDSRQWYRREIRIVRNRPDIMSYRDAQGFRKTDNTKLQVKLIDAFVYHYGWVKPPASQLAKALTFHKYWHDDEWVKQYVGEHFDYNGIDSLTLFNETHPAVMLERIKKMNWQFDFDIKQKKLSFKNKILMQIEKWTGWRIGEYRNYLLR